MGTRSSRGKNGRAGKCVVNKKIRKRRRVNEGISTGERDFMELLV